MKFSIKNFFSKCDPIRRKLVTDLLLRFDVIMVNKCAAPECRLGYESVRKSQITCFHFSLKKIELKKQ